MKMIPRKAYKVADYVTITTEEAYQPQTSLAN
jgi:hypothetical protein